MSFRTPTYTYTANTSLNPHTKLRALPASHFFPKLSHSQHLDHSSPTYTYTASIPPRIIYLHCLQHLIYSPTYTHTACISIIYPHTDTYTAYISLNPHIYLHCPHLINPPPPHKPTQLASHLSPHIYLHRLHLIKPPHIPTPLASHFSPHIYLHSLHLVYPPDSTAKSITIANGVLYKNLRPLICAEMFFTVEGFQFILHLRVKFYTFLCLTLKFLAFLRLTVKPH